LANEHQAHCPTAGTRDDDLLPSGCLLNQLVEMSFCFLEADLDHGMRIPLLSRSKTGCGGR
jgi:hypothetical protein